MSQIFRTTTRFSFYARNASLYGRMTCAYCGCELNVNTATLDHVVPRSRSGHNGPTNIVVACGHCNSRKRNAPLSAFLRLLASELAYDRVAFEAPSGSTEEEVDEIADQLSELAYNELVARVRRERNRVLPRATGRMFACMYRKGKVTA